VPAAVAAGRALGIDVIPAIELSCRHPDHGSLHLLGYFVDTTAPPLIERIHRLHGERAKRAERILERIQAGTGVDLREDVARQAAGAPVGRPHIARAMRDRGLVVTVDEAFSPAWLGRGGAGHVWPEPFHLHDAIDVVHAAGGAAVLAHPSRWRDTQRTLAIAEAAVAAGLDGVEVDHPLHDADALASWSAFVQRHDLVSCAGSDFHGSGDASDAPLGTRTAPRRIVEELQARAALARGG
jgi:predicted metal-dependent phosphoesterase TrpH